MSLYKSLVFLSCLAVPAVTYAKKHKNATQPVEIVKSNMHVSQYPTFERYFLGFKLCEQLGLKKYSTVQIKDADLDVLKMKYGSNASPSFNECFNEIKVPCDNKKIILHICSSYQDPILSLSDYDRYCANDYVILTKNCKLHNNVKKMRSLLCCSLLLDSNTLIDVYIYKIFGCDAIYLYTSHATPIVVIIDENGNISHILDNVKSEQQIFDILKI